MGQSYQLNSLVTTIGDPWPLSERTVLRACSTSSIPSVSRIVCSKVRFSLDLSPCWQMEKKQSRFQKDLEKKTKLLKNTSSLFRKSCTNKLNSERFTKCPGDSKAMDFDPWISQASNHKVMSAELLPSVDYLLAPQKWVECPELACFQANMTGNPIFNGKIIRVIYIYVVYIHTRNVYYICTYYEFTCIYIYIMHTYVYIYTLWLYTMCESIKTDRAADHLWIPKWQISARHRRFWMTRYCWVRSAKSCWEFHSNARAKSQRLSRNYSSIYIVIL